MNIERKLDFQELVTFMPVNLRKKMSIKVMVPFVSFLDCKYLCIFEPMKMIFIYLFSDKSVFELRKLAISV